MVFRPKYYVRAYIVLILISAAVCAIPLLVPMPQGKFVIWIGTLVLAGITAYFAAIYPTMRYTFEGTSLRLSCGPFSSRINYKDINEINLVNMKLYKYFRLMGISSPGYYMGLYISLEGKAMVYCTETKEAVVIKTANRIFAVSPKNREEFVEALKEKLA